jgi:hypothetical protein
MILIVLVLAAPGVAVTFDLSNPSGVLGTQQGYNAGSATLTAYGYQLDQGPVFIGLAIGAAENLFGNTGGANGPGLGIANVPSHGIGDYLVELDFSNLYSQGFRNFTLTIGGIQDPSEIYYIYSFDAPSVPGSHEAISPHEVDFFLGSSDIGSHTLDISTWVDAQHVLGVRGSVVLQSVTAAPDGGSTLVLLGLASIGLMAAARRFGKNWPRSSQPCG